MDDDDSELILEFKNIWKIFGPNPDKVFKSKSEDLSQEEIRKKFRCVLALRDVSFSVNRGEFCVIMGLSGSGKSTMIRTILRLVSPTRGSVLYYPPDSAQYDVMSLKTKQLRDFRRSAVAMVFQNYGLLPHLNVLDNVTFGLRIKGVEKQQRNEKAKQVLDQVGLAGWENSFPHQLSGGMKQRVGIARALSLDPDILLMDEPFSGLDPVIRKQMQEELVNLQETLNQTIVFVTHDLDEALTLGDRIAIMREGRVVQLDTPEEIVTNPKDDYVRQFTEDATTAKVLTAGTVMADPQNVVYDWSKIKTTLLLLRTQKKRYAFVIDKKRRLKGIVTQDQLISLEDNDKSKGLEMRQMDLIKPVTCSPDMVMEELFPLVSESSYALAVVDDEQKLIGVVHSQIIIEAIS